MSKYERQVEQNNAVKVKDCRDFGVKGTFIGFNTQDSSRQIQRALH